MRYLRNVRNVITLTPCLILGMLIEGVTCHTPPCLEITRRVGSYEINEGRYHSHPHIYPHNLPGMCTRINSMRWGVMYQTACRLRRPPQFVCLKITGHV